MILLLACVEKSELEPPPEAADSAVDTDTDPEVDTGCTPSIWYTDGDGDGWGSTPIEACDPPSDAVASAGDCDDADATLHPDAEEQCDGVDQDCDGVVDDGIATAPLAVDADGDGYGDPDRIEDRCDTPAGYVTDTNDCDDADGAVHPGAAEWCNGWDDDCDGLVDDDDSPIVGASDWYADADGDGYGDASDSEPGCDPPTGYVADDTDCEDADASVNPGAAEICLDFVDQDCDGYEDYSCFGTGEADVDLCDPTIVPVDVALCTAGVAAVLASGAAYGTVQDAVDAAVPGDIVTVCPGTWTEDLAVNQSPLSIVGYGAGTSILAGAGGTVLTLGRAAVLTVLDVEVRDGVAYDGAGLYGYDADVCLAGVVFTGNAAGGDGGAIDLDGTGTLQMEDCRLDQNEAGYAGGAVILASYATTIEDTTFYDNWSGYEAGGLSIDSTSAVTITNTTFDANYADYSSGALEYGGWGPALTLDLTTVTFTDNEAGYEGGAISIGAWDDPTVTCVDCLFDGNTAGYEGGAVNMGSWDAGTFNAALSTFTGNTSRSGGALNLGGWGMPTANFVACVLDGNSATDSGGAMTLDVAGSAGWATVTVSESSVTSNTAAYDGGAQVDSNFATLTVTDSDWGTGGTDNSPDDVDGYTAYGAGSTFTCERGACY